MSLKDISFTSSIEGEQISVPMVFSGTCEGKQTLMQKIIILLFSDPSDNTRNYGAALQLLTKGYTSDTTIIKNTLDQAVSEIKLLLDEEYALGLHDIPEEEQLQEISVGDVSKTESEKITAEINVTSKANTSETALITI